MTVFRHPSPDVPPTTKTMWYGGHAAALLDARLQGRLALEPMIELARAAEREDKHGLRLSNTAALYLDNVEVPADHLIGGVEGKGLVQAVDMVMKGLAKHNAKEDAVLLKVGVAASAITRLPPIVSGVLVAETMPAVIASRVSHFFIIHL